MKPKVLVDICRILIHGGISASHGDPALLGMTNPHSAAREAVLPTKNTLPLIFMIID